MRKVLAEAIGQTDNRIKTKKKCKKADKKHKEDSDGTDG